MQKEAKEKNRTIKTGFILHYADIDESSSVVAQPQGYFDSILLQSKIGLFNRSLTLLCIAHSHCDAESLEEV